MKRNLFLLSGLLCLVGVSIVLAGGIAQSTELLVAGDIILVAAAASAVIDHYRT